MLRYVKVWCPGFQVWISHETNFSSSYLWLLLLELWHMRKQANTHPSFDVGSSFRLPSLWASTDYYKRKISVCNLLQKLIADHEEDLREADEDSSTTSIAETERAETSDTQPADSPQRYFWSKKKTRVLSIMEVGVFAGETSMHILSKCPIPDHIKLFDHKTIKYQVS